MAIVAYPALAIPDQATITLEANTTVFTSDLNSSVQTAELSGARWRMNLSYSNRIGSTARALRGFLAALNGMANRFYMVPPDLNQVGTATNAGTVNGAGQSGISLATTGWAVNQPLLLAAGDYIEVGGELKIVTQDVSSSGSGNATINFAPALRNTPANAQPIEVLAPRALMMLDNNRDASWQVSAPVIYSMSISCVEDVTV